MWDVFKVSAELFNVKTIFDQQGGEISQCIERFDPKPDDLGLVLKTHMVGERENWIPPIVFWVPYLIVGTRMCTP